ncbi:MAG: Cas10/Cmr2 second palm domain-containing protein, partial [Candidatus Dormibacteraceae bacterium]
TGQDQATLDWHFAQGGLAGGLAEIRHREYQTSDGCLILRPVTLEANPGPGSGMRSWRVVENAIDAFRGCAWRERHNKVKALRDALRAGPDAVASFLTRFNAGQGLPDVAPTELSLKARGWVGDRCGYFDAIEAVDWYLPLT